MGDFSIPQTNNPPVPSQSEVNRNHRAHSQGQANQADYDSAEPLAKSLPALDNVDSMKLATAKINSGSLSQDLEGLVKLREKRANKSSNRVNGLAAHLAGRYGKGGVAA